ncbi:hypothetical protein EV175_006208 [Coemansia sp. RSA 1933]|nr:hypothetical protein EV175_006208 [Coemansia sp. RSA 1933]
MAMRNLEEQQTARLNHLHTASRMAFRICPQLAAFYGNQFCSALGPQKVANSITRYQCPYCGSPLVDGRSVARVSVVPSQRLQKASDAREACGTKMASKRKTRAKNRSKRIPKSDSDCKRRVINVSLSDTANTGQPKLSKEERANAQKDVKNSVEYICRLCDSRIVFPGATVSGLDAAGLSDNLPATNTDSSGVGRNKGERLFAKTNVLASSPSPRTKPDVAHIEPHAIASNKHTPKTPTTPTTPLSVQKDAVTAADSKITDSQNKKRKRYKSNLLATVAANKKKAEDKKSNSAFSLNDFLSNL